METRTLKIGGGRLSVAQWRWLDAFRSLGGDVGVYVWTPADWPELERVLGCWGDG